MNTEREIRITDIKTIRIGQVENAKAATGTVIPENPELMNRVCLFCDLSGARFCFTNHEARSYHHEKTHRPHQYILLHSEAIHQNCLPSNVQITRNGPLMKPVFHVLARCRVTHNKHSGM